MDDRREKLKEEAEKVKASMSFSAMLSDRYNIRPNRGGFILCPFHGEKTPSFKVYPRYGRCYGCGWSGDIIAFVQKYENLTFVKALQTLGGQVGGGYAPPSGDEARRRQVAARDYEIARQRAHKRLLDACRWVDLAKVYAGLFEPFSEAWCYAMEDYSKAVIERDICENEWTEYSSR